MRRWAFAAPGLVRAVAPAVAPDLAPAAGPVLAPAPKLAPKPALTPAITPALAPALAALWLGAAWPASTHAQGDAARGQAIVASRSQGLCSLCHAVPGQPSHLHGNIGPPLAGVGARLDADSLRAHLVQPERFNPDTVMPSYARTDFDSPAQQRVPAALRGKPLLSAAQIDDVVAYLVSLK